MKGFLVFLFVVLFLLWIFAALYKNNKRFREFVKKHLGQYFECFREPDEDE